jgi:hypothetical protein
MGLGWLKAVLVITSVCENTKYDVFKHSRVLKRLLVLELYDFSQNNIQAYSRTHLERCRCLGWYVVRRLINCQEI